MEDLIQSYLSLCSKLKEVREKNNGMASDEETDILNRMNVYWKSFTDEELKIVKKKSMELK